MSFESKLAAITVAFLIYGSSYRQQLQLLVAKDRYWRRRVEEIALDII